MERVGVVGLGYVGLPVAVAFGKAMAGTVGFDIDRRRIYELRSGHDRTGEVEPEDLQATEVDYTDRPDALAECTFIIVTVPTPIDEGRRPDLNPLRSASRAVGKVLRPGTIVVFESTVYPGVTEDVCAPILEAESGLRAGEDFFLGYSPERINPGDKVHRLETITKVVSASDAASLDRVASTYAAVVQAGVHRAPSIRVAEMAKVIENTQRDLNIAFVNELALICERLGIRTMDVLRAAGTKWNFLPFTPGLVGGHCIGVDPYYLTARAEQVGYHPQVILAGRRINDDMGRYVASRVVKALGQRGVASSAARVGVLGLTFKENVGDVRNSRVPDIIEELVDCGCQVVAHDPLADPDELRHELGVEPSELAAFRGLDALIVAVSHQSYRELIAAGGLGEMLRADGVLFDVKSMITDPSSLPDTFHYESL